ncbi:hypothetical protein GobsT_24520 [Gemmata obscuriglobus]|uniref:Uncharacterized protein n=2 Tax=Gemmata obscuriglobus TaxID=114 RepID=A0A2Z3GXP1_9BACT|nr:hypothetical protein C1280_21185 [Gemmata obscuriglobus]QEG27693.1 hypothetical protein GobsT_24520 [Gemmata obscuriglobus]VTS04911.1 unnamed protein product [Gemmata obscuriglobus UQM 2246]
MRVRVIGAFALICLGVVTAAIYYRWRTAGYEEVQAVTERIAAASARQDREALVSDPLLTNHAAAADFLLRHSAELGTGYRVKAVRNGADGYQLMSGNVTHLGRVSTASGTLHLGFRYDREKMQLEFVTASFSTLSSPMG